MAKIGNQGDGGGRPPVVFNEHQTAQVFALAGCLTKAQMADFFGISETTLREVEKRQPEVYEAYKKGRANAMFEVADNLINKAKDGDTTAQIFFLKTQAGWREDKAEERDIPPININVTPSGSNDPTK